MWPWLLLLTTANFLYQSPTLAVDTSVGPTSQSEAQILWKDSQTLYKEGKCSDAIAPLRRLIDRYPGYPSTLQYHEIRFELGACYFELKQDARALSELRLYLSGSVRAPHADTARLFIGESLLSTHQLPEAYLIAQELIRSHSRPVQTRGLLLRAKVLLAMDEQNSSSRRLEAQAAIRSAQTLASQLHSHTLAAESAAAQVALSVLDCKLQFKADSTGKMDEQQVHIAAEGRGTCLQQALITFRAVLTENDEKSAQQALELMITAFSDYQKFCKMPPDPPALKPKDRTAAQLSTYRQELTDELKRLCGEKQEQARQMLIHWQVETITLKPSGKNQLKILEESLQ